LIEDHKLGRILTARLGGELVGVAVISFLWTLEHGGPAAWLDEVYVEPSRRGGGIGRKLVEAAMQVARDSGCIALDLEVDAGHEAAERLYERMGFRRHRRVRWVRML
jgi:GNAT superfamily N-acetyltransferase